MQTWRALDLNAQAESSSMFLSLQNGLRLQDSTYWTYTQAMMHTWWPSNLILGSRKSSWSFAYCLKSHHGVRGFHLLRLHHKDSLWKRVVLERYPHPQISRILQVADFRFYYPYDIKNWVISNPGDSSLLWFGRFVAQLLQVRDLEYNFEMSNSKIRRYREDIEHNNMKKMPEPTNGRI